MENTFGKYRIAAPIATRSSNPAYHARPVTATEWGWVVKVYNNHKLHTLAAQEEWQHNMATLMHLEHPYILPIIATGIEEEVPYNVTKYMEEGSLRDRLNRLFPEQLAIQDVKNIILQIGQALQHAHDQHILHGNIKPENILFNEHGDALLSDFRVPWYADETDPSLPSATPLMQESEGTTDDSSKLQLTYYPALESLSEKSDQYALGCLAYELLTGRLQTAMLSSKLPSVQPLPQKTLTVASPPDYEWIRQIETVLHKAVAEEPDVRYENVAAFLDEFERACSLRSSTEPASGMFAESWPIAKLIHARNTVRQFPTLEAIKTSLWRRSDWLMQIYQTYKENTVWRWSAIVVPLVILVTFCILLISHFTSSQHAWQAVATPTLQVSKQVPNGTVESVTPESEGFALQQQGPTPTPTTYANAAPAVSSGVGSSITPTQAATSNSGSGGHKSHKSHKSSHSGSSSSGSPSDSSSSGSSSSSSPGSSSSGSSSSSSPGSPPTPTPTPLVTPTPTSSSWPTPPGSTGPHCSWGGYGCNPGGRGGWGGWGGGGW